MDAVRRGARWVAPSFALAALAVSLAALHDSVTSYDGASRVAAGAGFAVLVSWPFALGLSLAARVTSHVWRPRRLFAALVDPSGGAPRLAAWLVALVAAAALLAVLSHQVVWLFARSTAFKPRTMSLAIGPVMIVVVGVVVLVTPVIAAAVGAALGWIERRWARWRGAPLLTSRRVVIAAAVGAGTVVAIAWHLVIRPRFANVSFAGLTFPTLTLAFLAGAHLAWSSAGHAHARTRLVAAICAAVLAAGLAGTAQWARQARPAMVLGLWGTDAFAADAIELLYDLHTLRDDLPRSAVAPVPIPGAPRRDVLLVTIDTFRPDRIRPYGGPQPTPALTDLATRGVVFEWAFSPSNVTRRSMPSIATGLAPTRIRGKVAGWALRMDPRHITVAERLRAGGYATIGLFCCEGFWERRRRLGLDRGIDDLFIRHDGQDLVAAYRERLAGRRPDGPPTFTWIHFIELHEWAGGNPDLTPERRRNYDEILTRVDGWLGELMEASAALPPERQPIIIVTGDHSEAFGDHGEPFHSTDLYNSQIRVPLIVTGPGVPPARVHEPVGLADLAPTILELAGFVPPGFPQMDGRSLADLLTGRRPPDPDGGRAYAVTIIDRYVRDRRSALVLGRWKLIHQLGRWELYDLRTDANELRDLSRGNPARLQELQAQMRARWLQDQVSAFP